MLILFETLNKWTVFIAVKIYSVYATGITKRYLVTISFFSLGNRRFYAVFRLEKKRKKCKEKKNIMVDHLDVFVNKIRKRKSDSSRLLRRIPSLSGVIQVDWKGNKNKIKERPLAIKTKKCFFV